MCRHNEQDDFDCCDCAYERGKEHAIDGEPKACEYKNFDQCESYHNGYADGQLERYRLIDEENNYQ